METLSRGADVIRRAEGELRGLLAQAADLGEYDNLRVLADWAKQLGTMIQDVPANGNSPQSHGERGTDPARKPLQDTSNNDPQQRSRKLNGATGKRGLLARKSGSRKHKREEYPKFFREGEELIKVGWSKSEKATYEHKAPKRVLSLLIEALVRAGTTGERFTMEELLPLRASEDDSEVPSYQAYLTLAWLRSENLIVQHGRQGYSLPSDTNLPVATEECWQHLPRR